MVTLLSRMFEALTFVFLEANDTVFYDECPTGCYVIAAVSEFLVTFNSAANFFCYCYFGRKFRQILFRRLDRCGLGSCCPWLRHLQREQSGGGGGKGSQTSVTSSSLACQTVVTVADTRQ